MSKENNKRGKYNEKYNLEALEKMYSILEKRNYWMSSLQLAEISGREHNKVRRDIERDIIGKLQDLRHDITTNEKKFRKVTNLNDFIVSIDSCKYDVKHYKDSMNRNQDVYMLNREASLLCLARYNYAIQTRINSLFLELYDKEKEGDVNDVKNINEPDNRKTFYEPFSLIDIYGNKCGKEKVFEVLRTYKVLQSSKSKWNVPYQMYVKNGYFRILLSNYNELTDTSVVVVRITPKGMDFINSLLSDLGYMYEESSLYELKTFVSNDDYGEEELDFYK